VPPAYHSSGILTAALTSFSSSDESINFQLRFSATFRTSKAENLQILHR